MRVWRTLLFTNLIIFVLLLAFRLKMEYGQVVSFPINSWTDAVEADCGIVLTGGPDRVREALDLLYRRSVRKLIISGVNPKVAEVRDVIPQWPFYGDLKEEDVVLERRSMTTYGNAVQSLPLVEALHCRRVVLVTSALHMSRAYKTFRGVFPMDLPITPYAVAGGAYRPAFVDAMSETFKSLFYSFWAY